MRQQSTIGSQLLLLSAALVGSTHAIIVKARHYDTETGTIYDLNVCRPLAANRIVLLQDICDEADSMPGWRPRIYDSDNLASVVQLFGPPFSPYTDGGYEEPRNVAVWGGSLFYNDDPWKPVMFRTGQDSELGYNWRQPFRVERNGRYIVTTEDDLAVGDILQPIKAEDDTNPSILNFPGLVSCDTPSGRVLRRYDANRQQRYEAANCLDVDLYVSSQGYLDPDDLVNAPPIVGLGDLSTSASGLGLDSELESDPELDKLLKGIQDYQAPSDDDPIWDLLREVEQEPAGLIDYPLTDEEVENEFQYLVNDPYLSAEDELAQLLGNEEVQSQTDLERLQAILDELAVS
ncbi:hypothetical protein TWF696_003215 [Orbilia brochopaga]|uniref:Uncharacterized protein n=1 Tax=Orbilia brochopaga TaxID=3140254 RepID=A0AAV9TXT9_9PEZI